jgi:hypothetical protein
LVVGFLGAVWAAAMTGIAKIASTKVALFKIPIRISRFEKL